MYNEIQRLKEANSVLIETSEAREQAFQSQLSALLQQVNYMKNSYTQREETYTEETQRLSNDLDKYHTLLEEAQRNMESGEGVSVNYNLTKEIETMQSTMTEKSEELNKIRNLYISEKHAER